jgi:hypothetical protein
MEKARQSISEVSRLVVVALIASLLVLVAPFQAPSHASGSIVYNNRVCDLGDPNNHSTSDTAFEISTPAQLWEVTDCVSSSATIYFELANDIDVSEVNDNFVRRPIGSASAAVYSFSGVLNGKGKEIREISMNQSSGAGLFAYLHNATISDLVLSGELFSLPRPGPPTLTGPAGALAISASGTLHLDSVINRANVYGTQNVGGLVGRVGAGGSVLVSSSSNYGLVTGSVDHVGGLFGLIEGNLSASSISNAETVSGLNAVGGLAGYVAGDLYIQSSSNVGAIEGNIFVGGLVGASGDFVGPPKVAYITGSYNTGPVTAVDSLAGGLLGAHFGLDLDVFDSYNTGPISGPEIIGGLVGGAGYSNPEISVSFNAGSVSGTSQIGGLVAQSDTDVHLYSSYNVGAISGSNQVGGLVGNVLNGANAEVVSAYNTGLVSGTTDIDGLVGTLSGTVTATYVYTSVTSRFTATSTVAEMKLSTTYVGFDFTNVWGFGVCTDNQGFPLLRAFATVGTYYVYSCGLNVAPAPDPTPTPGQGSVTAPTYNGPIVDSTPINASPGETFVLTGSRLGGITQVFVNGVSLDIVSSSEFELVLKLDLDAQTGIFDLVIISPFGRLTVMDAISIRNLEAKMESYGELLGFRWAATFIGNSRSLSPSQTEGILGHLNSFDSATTIVCWGYTTSETPNDWAIAHANTRAQEVCDQLALAAPNVRVLVRVRYGMPKFAAMRATMQFWELKSSQ